jgi:hypothetical protein
MVTKLPSIKMVILRMVYDNHDTFEFSSYTGMSLVRQVASGVVIWTAGFEPWFLVVGGLGGLL